MKRQLVMATLALLAFGAPRATLAWGYEGHEIIAEIARAYMTPSVLANVDALLLTDTDNTLTPLDMASQATWADAWRGAGHRETANWHFVDLELDGPDMKAACYGFPPGGAPASNGTANACITDKLEAFVGELSDPATAPAERLLALKYVLHFVGDIHQPLHVSDNHDHGGNCVALALGGPRTVNLHSFWDTGVLAPLGSDPVAAARALIATITAGDVKTWSAGAPRDWALESYQVARESAYTIGSRPGCDAGTAPIALPTGYANAAAKAADRQLQKAGVRLAMVLNTALRS